MTAGREMEERKEPHYIKSDDSKENVEQNSE